MVVIMASSSRSGQLREIAVPFVAAAPAGARVRTRLRVTAEDEAVLRAVGRHLGSLAGRDLAVRCAEGRLDARGRAVSRRERKRALTAESSSRWAGAITRTSEDQHALAMRNLGAERASLRARVRRITTRLAVRAGEKRGYATPAERHAKTIRLKALQARLARAEARAGNGTVPVARGGRRLLHARGNLEAAGLTLEEWCERWDAARLFITADGERGKPYGNETIRFSPGEGWLELKLPAPLSHLANQSHGRYRLAAPAEFTYRGDEVAAQATSGAVRYDISFDPAKGRWYIDASWKLPARPAPPLEELQRHPVVAVDVNAGHLDAAVLSADGNVTGTPWTVPLDFAGLPAASRDGRLRAAISGLIATAKDHGARAIVIEDLDFAGARAEGRERQGNRPSRGRRGRGFRRAVAGIPTARLRDRLAQMTTNAGLSLVIIDPAYTSRWAAEHWLPLLRQHHPEATGHHAAACVTGRRGLGYRARRRAHGNRPVPEDTGRPARTRPGPTRQPAPTQESRHPTRPPAATRCQDQAASQDNGGPPGGARPLGATHQAVLTIARC